MKASDRERVTDSIESVCAEVLKSMNLTREQMVTASCRLTEYMMSDRSKLELKKVTDVADGGFPNGIESLRDVYKMVFMLGYTCGSNDVRGRCRSEQV